MSRTGYHLTIAMNWRRTALVGVNTIVSLIGSTHSRAGLHVRAELDRGRYPAGITVTDAQIATVQLTRQRFHGDRNDTIRRATPWPLSQLLSDRHLARLQVARYTKPDPSDDPRYLDWIESVVVGVEESFDDQTFVVTAGADGVVGKGLVVQGGAAAQRQRGRSLIRAGCAILREET